MSRVLILNMDVMAGLALLPDESVHCGITSPPYWGLRSYLPADHSDKPREIGQEKRLDCLGWTRGENCGACYICVIRNVFAGVYRVLRPDGTLWVNQGDSYHNGDKGGYLNGRVVNSPIQAHALANDFVGAANRQPQPGLKPKDLCGQPWRIALALQAPNVEPCIVRKETDRAWLAAMFDGEGTIGIRRYDSYRTEVAQMYQDGFVAYTSMANSDVPLLDKCVEITGLGQPRIKQRAGYTDKRMIVTRRDNYGWRLDGNAAVDIIRAAWPYLIAKRKQAALAYTLDVLNKESRAERGNGPVSADSQAKKVRLWEMIKACNQRQPVDIPDWVVEPKQKVTPGWWWRDEIIWHKKSCMPSSQRDRCTRSHEVVLMFTKQERYFYDIEAIKEPVSQSMLDQIEQGYEGSATKDYEGAGVQDPSAVKSRILAGRASWNGSTFDTGKTGEMKHTRGGKIKVPGGWDTAAGTHGAYHREGRAQTPEYRDVEPKRSGNKERKFGADRGRPDPHLGASVPWEGFTRTKRTVWSLGPEPFKESHFATFPCALVEPMVLAGCPEGGTVLDPFGGAGTTGLVAARLQRNAILIELNSKYAEMSQRRIIGDAPLLVDVEIRKEVEHGQETQKAEAEAGAGVLAHE